MRWEAVRVRTIPYGCRGTRVSGEVMGQGVSRACCRGLPLLEVLCTPLCCLLVVLWLFFSTNLILGSTSTSEQDLQVPVSSQDTWPIPVSLITCFWKNESIGSRPMPTHVEKTSLCLLFLSSALPSDTWAARLPRAVPVWDI